MDSLFNDEVLVKSQQRFRSDHHRVYTEEVNKIALSSNNDKKNTNIWWSYNVSLYLNVFKACQSEILSKNKWCAD